MNPTLFAAKSTAARNASIAARVTPADTAKRVTLGKIQRDVLDDGVRKSKSLEPGMVVRPFVHGVPRGSERTVETVERIGDGEFVRITFSSLHPQGEFKAAYRWYVADLDGAPTGRTETVAAFVSA